MALDVGDKRIGVAVTDQAEMIASPVGVIERRGDKKDICYLENLIKDLGVEMVVIGLPFDSRGQNTSQADKISDFAKKVEKFIKVEFYDERFSTKEALKSFQLQGIKEKKGKKYLDEVSASLILQSYMERRKNK